jgi:hypothetical protein
MGDHMRTILRGLGLAMGVLLMFALISRADDDDKVPIEKLPKEVTDAIKKKWPKAELVSATKDTDEKGEVTYDVTIKVKKQELDVTLTPEGAIVQVEKEIEVKAVPKVVMDAIKKMYPKATFQGASEISKDDKVAEYELDLVTKDKKNLYVTFDKEGKFIHEEPVEEEPAKDKKDDAKDKKDK